VYNLKPLVFKLRFCQLVIKRIQYDDDDDDDDDDDLLCWLINLI